MTYETINVQDMSPACGAIVEGFDLSKELTNREFDEIHRAVVDRVVVVFRDQDLTPEQHVALSRRFGEVQPAEVSAFEKSAEYPEIDILEYDADNPPHVTRDLWHTDFAGTARPTWGTLLYARDIPAGGGDTIWVNAVAAYEALSDRMKAHIEGLWAYHDSYRPYGEHVRPEMYEGDKGADHLRTPEFQYRHKWRENDLAIWDNRTSLHYALFDYTEHRLIHRIIIRGDEPYA